MKTEITKPGCNGWAVVESKYFDATTAKNIHVLEVKISHENGRIMVYPNADKISCCEQLKLKSSGWTYLEIFNKEQVNELRTYLSSLQNGKYETCGNCAKHFYADNV